VDQFSTHGMEQRSVVARCFFTHTPVSVGYWVERSLVVGLTNPGDGLREGAHGAGGVPEPIHRLPLGSCQNSPDVVERRVGVVNPLLDQQVSGHGFWWEKEARA